jgi:serine/threonine protein kinase
VALKKISKRFTNSSTFQTETNALLRIYDNGGHPNISGLRDMYEDYSHFYLVMDLISGGEMFDHLSHDGAYSEADAARLIFEIASALAFLHGVGTYDEVLYRQSSDLSGFRPFFFRDCLMSLFFPRSFHR